MCKYMWLQLVEIGLCIHNESKIEKEDYLFIISINMRVKVYGYVCIM